MLLMHQYPTSFWRTANFPDLQNSRYPFNAFPKKPYGTILSMKAFVIGGAGFIGSHLVDLLLKENHEVVVLDNLSSGNLKNLRGPIKSKKIRFIQDDILTTNFDELFKEHEPEVIFSLAAQIDVRKSVDNPLHDAEVNILAIIRMAEAARKSGVRKIVHTSSGGSIYGLPTEFPVSETQPVDPHSPYAVSKVAGELYLNAFSHLYGIETSYIAPSNVYGPRQNPNGEAGVVAIFSQKMLSGQPTMVFGGGRNTRDYVFVGDVADAFLAAAKTRCNGARFNIGTGIETSDLDLHRTVADAVGCTQNPEFMPARLGDLPRSSLDSTYANEILGWSPSTSLADGIKATVQYFRDQTSTS